MTEDEYCKAIDRVGLNQVGAAHFFGVNERTSRRWALGEQPVPRTVELVLWLMVKCHVRAEHIPLILRWRF